jgi:hypothetical protein
MHPLVRLTLTRYGFNQGPAYREASLRNVAVVKKVLKKSLPAMETASLAKALVLFESVAAGLMTKVLP